MDPAEADWCAATVAAASKKHNLPNAGFIASKWGDSKYTRELQPGEKSQAGDIYMDYKTMTPEQIKAREKGAHIGMLRGQMEPDGEIPVNAGDVRLDPNNPKGPHSVEAGYRNINDVDESNIHILRLRSNKMDITPTSFGGIDTTPGKSVDPSLLNSGMSSNVQASPVSAPSESPKDSVQATPVSTPPDDKSVNPDDNPKGSNDSQSVSNQPSDGGGASSTPVQVADNMDKSTKMDDYGIAMFKHAMLDA
jgi:hypothetical protein